MRVFINFVIVFSLLILAFSLGFLFYYHSTFVPSASFSGEIKIKNDTFRKKNTSSEQVPSESESENPNEVPDEVFNQVENLAPVVTSYFLKLKNGISTYPALIFKVVSEQQSMDVYLLTYFPMEWQFVKVKLKGAKLGAPEKVYSCPGGLLLLDYRVRGIFPVEVERGSVGDYGALVTWTGSSFDVEVYDSKKGCADNGFVFNLAGDFAGICFGGNFYSAEELYSTVPDACTLTYGKEEGSGNLQGEDGQLVR